MNCAAFNIKRGERFSGSICNGLGNDIEARMTRDSLLRIEGNGCGVGIHAEKGALWITQENDPKDRLLISGEFFTVSRPGVVIICALEDAEISIHLNSFQQKLEMALNQTYSAGGCWKIF